MKAFTIVKVGYSAGVYGNTGEYYQTTIIKDDDLMGLPFVGQFGADYRVAAALKELGYIEKHTKSGGYGRLTGEQKKYFISEYTAIEEIKAL